MGLASLQVCMDSSDWLQGTIHEESGMDSSSPSGEMLTCSRPLIERRLRPQHDQALKCPRCDSTHTKFCYYNNYSLSQPRYFCKTCRRYWTKGGTLRNIPVGGGCRKNKKVASKKSNDQSPINQHPSSSSSSSHNATDLHLSFPDVQFSQLNNCSFLGNPSYMETKYSGIMMDTHRPIDFMESKWESIVGNPRTNNYDFMGSNEQGLVGAGIGVGDVSSHGFPLGFHGLVTPYGMPSVDGSGNHGNFMDTCPRMMLPYNEGNEEHDGLEVKPNTKLLALEWQDQECSDVGKDNFGYLTNGQGPAWNNIVNGCYGPSTTNPLV